MKLALAALAAALLLAGCDTGQSVSSRTSDQDPGPGVSQIKLATDLPKPDKAQSAKLIEELDEVAPALGETANVQRARNLCERLLGSDDEQEVVDSAQREFSESHDLTTAQAERIVEIVRDSEWCKA